MTGLTVLRYDRGMAAHPLIIPLSKFTSYSDAFLGSAVSSTKQLLSLNLPVPASIFLPPSSLEQFYQTSPQRQRVIDLFRRLNDTESATDQNNVISQLKNTIAILAINRQLVHTLTDGYHDFLGGGEVETVAAHISNLSRHSAKGNVNFIESILRIWADSLEMCLLKKGQSPQACLTPTGIFIQAQPKVDLSGIIFTNHPQKLTKASLVVYLWQNSQKSSTQQPAEVLDLDMRSGMILRRHHLPVATKQSSPIAISTEQLTTIVVSGSRIKQHYFQETSASFIISNQQLFFTQLPTDYQIDLPVNKTPQTATKLLLHASLVSQAKRTETISDGVGIFDIDLSKQYPQQLLPIIRDLNQLSPAHQTLLIRPSSTVLHHDWSRYAQLLTQLQNECNRPIALLPNQLKSPEDWLAIASLPIFKASITHPRPLWLEIATPGMALSLRSIDLNQVGGLVINQPQLLAWATGNNLPDKNSQQSSSHHHLIFAQLLESITIVVRSHNSAKPPPIWVELNQADSLLIANIICSGCQAILSSASELSTIKDCIQQAEKEIWLSRVSI